MSEEPTKPRIWVLHCPFRKDGVPSLGSFGRTIDPVVILRLETWTRLPALDTLLDQNTNKEKEPVVQLDANGHVYVKDGERQYSQCSVTLKTLGQLVE